MRGAGGRWLSVVLIAVGGLAFAVADVSHYLNRNVFDAQRFADHGTAALHERAVRVEIANRVATRAIAVKPDLANVRPVIELTVTGLAGTPAFEGLVRSGLFDLHRAALDDNRDSTTLRILDAGSLVSSALDRFAPEAGAKVPDGLDVVLVSVTDRGAGGVATDFAQAADTSARGLRIAWILAALCFAAAVMVAPDRRRACWRVALAVAVACALVVVVFYVARGVITAQGNGADAPAALRALFESYFGGLRDLNVYLAGAALVVAVAIAAPVRSVDPLATVRRLAARAAVAPASPRGRAARAFALVIAGVIAVLARDTVLSLLVVGAGGLAVLIGISELMRVLLPRDGIDKLELSRPAIRRRGLAAGAVAAVAIGAGGVALAGTGDDRPPFRLTACNGDASLCDRPLNRVVFPSTHNSMGAASEHGWLFASQEDGIPQQLRAGVRGLFIDTHYGVRTSRGVHTELDRGSKSRGKLEQALGPKFLAAVEAARRRIDYKGGGTPRVYLCHAFCEVGATDAVKALRTVRDFVVANPGEVIVIGLEDSVTPADTEKAFRDSGLLDHVYRGPVEPLPTLRDMIDDGGRVLVMSEERVGDVPWLRQQYGLVQETPYSFPTVAALESPESCDANRGRADNPLFLINHWVETTPAPRAGNARRANSTQVLLGRARRCQKARGRLPNFLSVDLYREGDLFGVARTLNGGAND